MNCLSTLCGQINPQGDRKIMVRKDIKIQINTILWENAIKKIETVFGSKYTKTDCMLVIMLLALYKRKNKSHSKDNPYRAVKHPNQLATSAYKSMTIAVYDGLLERLQEQYPSHTYCQIIAFAIADFLMLPTTFYTDCITPLYTIVGSKNYTMQMATASAVDNMKLPHESITLIDGCCATGSLFMGLKTYPWKAVILNDLNPLRTNFLNVLKREPLKLVKKILETDLSFIDQPETKNPILKEYKELTNNYVKKRTKYQRGDCNVDIAYKMFILQCIDKANIDKSDRILQRTLKFIPAHIKLQNAIITQEDCLSYLENDDNNKLVLLDVPYIGSEHTCGITGYNYKPFHEKVAEYLHNATYTFLYYCRSTPPKSEKTFAKADAEYIMKMKLACHFMGKGYHFQKVPLKADTELIISNRQYDVDAQFQWTSMEQEII